MIERSSVAILVQTSTSWGRELVEGIAEYVQEHGPWIVFVEPRGLLERLSVPETWRGDGIIARIDRPELYQQIVELGVPAVNVSWSSVDPTHVPSVRVDDEACGELAADHLVDAGLRSFGYVGQRSRSVFMNERLFDGFSGRLARSGFAARAYADRETASRLSAMPFREELEHLAGWLKGFGEPVGLLAFGDAEARLIVQACELVGLRVPEDVAIVGSEQDALMSSLCGMGISSVNLNGQSVGYRAAAMLDDMMNGRPLTNRMVRIPPAGVVGRESTDGTAVKDELVREALVFIRDHIAEPIRVRDLAQRLGVARRTLESRFRNAIGRSPGEAIRRLRVEKAARLLADTQLPLGKVAERCGYAEPRLLTAHFRQIHEMTPTAYRKLRRQGGPSAGAGDPDAIRTVAPEARPMPEITTVPSTSTSTFASPAPSPSPAAPFPGRDPVAGGTPVGSTPASPASPMHPSTTSEYGRARPASDRPSDRPMERSGEVEHRMPDPDAARALEAGEAPTIETEGVPLKARKAKPRASFSLPPRPGEGD
ncbi:MAG: substrate-binding domain-containing protein [Phycisphaerales bacterium]